MIKINQLRHRTDTGVRLRRPNDILEVTIVTLHVFLKPNSSKYHRLVNLKIIT